MPSGLQRLQIMTKTRTQMMRYSCQPSLAALRSPWLLLQYLNPVLPHQVRGSFICHCCIVLTLNAIWLPAPVNKSHKRTAINASASSGASSNESDKESSDSSSSELSDSEDDDLSRLVNNAPKALADALAKEVSIPFHLALIMTTQILYLSVQSGQMIRG